jgi:hypothetical protein
VATPDPSNLNTLPEHLQIHTDKVRTAGWKRFDEWVHFGINFGLNVVLAMAQSVFQTNYEINQKIDAANQAGTGVSNELAGFQNQKKRTTLGMDKYFAGVEKFKRGELFGGKIGGPDTWFGVEFDAKGNPLHAERAFYSKVATNVLTLSNAGHLTTLVTEFFENKNIKPKLVRWFDKKIDEKRIAKGDTPSEAELQERAAVYDKLDHELAGKSVVQVWSSRAIGISVVIGSLIGLGKLDNKMTGAALDGEAGLFRLGQASKWAAQKTDAYLDGSKSPNWLKSPQWLKDSAVDFKTQPTPNTYFANKMTEMFATEVVGSGITAAAQYCSLMFKELFCKKEHQSTPPALENRSAATSQTQATTTENRAEATPQNHPQQEEAKPKFQHAAHRRAATNTIQPRPRHPIAPRSEQGQREVG